MSDILNRKPLKEDLEDGGKKIQFPADEKFFGPKEWTPLCEWLAANKAEFCAKAVEWVKSGKRRPTTKDLAENALKNGVRCNEYMIREGLRAIGLDPDCLGQPLRYDEPPVTAAASPLSTDERRA